MIVAKLPPWAVQGPSQAKYLHASLYWSLLLIRAKNTFPTITFEKGCPPGPLPRILGAISTHIGTRTVVAVLHRRAGRGRCPDSPSAIHCSTAGPRAAAKVNVREPTTPDGFASCGHSGIMLRSA